MTAKECQCFMMLIVIMMIMIVARKYLPSGRESNFPDKISLNPLMVSSNCTKRPPDDSNSDDSDYDDSMIVIMMVQKNYHPHPNVHHSFSSS